MTTKVLAAIICKGSLVSVLLAVLPSAVASAAAPEAEASLVDQTQQVLGRLLCHKGDGIRLMLAELPPNRVLLILWLLGCLLTGFFGFVLGRSGGWRQGVSSAFKLPTVYLASMVLTFPPLMVVGAFFGLRHSVVSMLALMLGSFTLNGLLLGCFAPILGLVSASSDYHSTKLMAVLIGGFSALLSVSLPGQVLLLQVPVGYSGLLFVGWTVLYAFCGTQCAWLLRPLLGEPGLPFQWLRPFTKKMTFLGAVFASIQARIPNGSVHKSGPPPSGSQSASD